MSSMLSKGNRPAMSLRRTGLDIFLPDSTRVLKWFLFMRIQKLSVAACTIKGLDPSNQVWDQVSFWQEYILINPSLLPLISTHLLSRLLVTSLNSFFWLSVLFLVMVKLSIITRSLMAHDLHSQIKLFSRFLTTKLSSGNPNSFKALNDGKQIRVGLRTLEEKIFVYLQTTD